jgi:hypothetical protein
LIGACTAPQSVSADRCKPGRRTPGRPARSLTGPGPCPPAAGWLAHLQDRSRRPPCLGKSSPISTGSPPASTLSRARSVDVAPLTAAKIVGNDWCHQVQQSRATSEALAGTDLIFAGRWCWRSTRHRRNPRGQPLGLSPGPHAGAVSPCVDVLARGAGSRDGACPASDTRGRGRSARLQ